MAKQHKYIDKKWVNGKWKYIYKKVDKFIEKAGKNISDAVKDATVTEVRGIHDPITKKAFSYKTTKRSGLEKAAIKAQSKLSGKSVYDIAKTVDKKRKDSINKRVDKARTKKNKEKAKKFNKNPVVKAIRKSAEKAAKKNLEKRLFNDPNYSRSQVKKKKVKETAKNARLTKVNWDTGSVVANTSNAAKKKVSNTTKAINDITKKKKTKKKISRVKAGSTKKIAIRANKGMPLIKR